MRIPLVAFALLGLATPTAAQTAADSAAIRATALDYIEGWYAGDGARMERALHPRYDQKVEQIRKGDELPPGVNKLAKCYIAMKRKIQIGDKMAGRHGNKGVVATVVPEEDVPFLPDGTPVDVVLNPLGVPSRMNVGQILENHLGWAAKAVGKMVRELLERQGSLAEVKKCVSDVITDVIDDKTKMSAYIDEIDQTVAEDIAQNGIFIASPVFEGTKEEQIRKLFKKTGILKTGQTVLYDGKTGERFEREVTVGVMYMLKLHHLVDDMLHARSSHCPDFLYWFQLPIAPRHAQRHQQTAIRAECVG